jgi:long-chain acyl-CoA synthetase
LPHVAHGGTVVRIVTRSTATPAPPPVVRLLPQLADHAARQYGDAPFLLRWTPDGWDALSFVHTARAMHAFAALLVRAGVRAGDRVGLQSENRVEWGIAYLAILAAGAVVVPLDAQLQEREVGEILETADARFCIVSARERATVEAARAARVPDLRLIALDDEPDLPSLPEALRSFADPPAHEPRGAPDDLAVLLFTSGTTGQAKGVMLSHLNLLSNVEGVARTFEFGPHDRLLSVLPLHHTFESTAGFLCPLRVGASVAYARGLKSNELREDIGTSCATIFLGVPLLYEKLLAGIHRGIDELPLPRRAFVKALLGITRLARRLTGARLGHALLRPVREGAGLACIRMFVSGAAALPSEVFWGFLDLGFPVVEGYGLTETSPVVAANRPAHPRPGAVGWPLQGVDVRIEHPDEHGNGEIVVRGPNVMLGYYGQPEMTAEVVRDGWFHTGDLGRFTPDGRLKITGRLKNMIATAAGKKVYPEEVEAALGNCCYILEVVVAGGRDPRTGREEVQAHVFPDVKRLEEHARATGHAFDREWMERTLRREIDARCAQLAPYKRVKRMFVRDQEFAKTTTGKIRRQAFTPATALARDDESAA